ncbi:MAG: DUF2069 domain-containing protein [Lysobacteraceae bacterium]
MSRAQGLSVLLLAAIAALLSAWYLWLLPPTVLPPGLVLGAMLVPALPGLALGVFGRRSAAFWAGVASLLYFSHGVMEAWTTPGALWLGLAEAGLACAVVVAAAWDAIAAHYRRRSAGGV